MKLTVNNQEKEAPDGCTVAEFAAQWGLSEKGTALAVNHQLVPRTEWAAHVLQPGDAVVVIQAACGG